MLVTVQTLLAARLRNRVRAPSSRASRGATSGFQWFFAGGAGLLGACSAFSDTLRANHADMEREQALRILYETIDVVNQQLPPARRLRKAPETVIVGASGSLDSLGIVSFVVTLEEKAGEVLGVPVELLDEAMLVDEDGPLRSVATLTSYLATINRG